MVWNYRVGFRKECFSVVDNNDHSKVIDVLEETQYGIVEAYYNDKGEITFTTEQFMEPYGETFDELKSSFEMVKEAFDLPVLDLDNIVYSKEY